MKIKRKGNTTTITAISKRDGIVLTEWVRSLASDIRNPHNPPVTPAPCTHPLATLMPSGIQLCHICGQTF